MCDNVHENDRKKSLSDKEYDPITFHVLKVKPEDLANQITLIDLPIFKSVTAEELSNGSWTKKNKRLIAPNVMNFTDRFNSVCLWCQREILNCEKASKRADVLNHFIKIAKQLFELNNLHSTFAIVSALQSHPIHRLSKTWNLVSRHDRSTFDKLARLFDSERNWERLRQHIDTMRLPCIPYLGMFLTDLNFIGVAAAKGHDSNFLEVHAKEQKVNNIIRMIVHFQDSHYDDILHVECIQDYLRTFQFHEELLKFAEDDMYKLSLKREIDINASTISSPCSSSPRNTIQFLSCSSFTKKLGSLPRIRLNRSNYNDYSTTNNTSYSHSLTPQLTHHQTTPKTSFGHRKTQSLGTNAMLGLENISFTLDSGSHTSSASTVPSMQSPSSDNIDCADLNTSQSTFYVNDADHNLLDSSKISANFKCLLNIASSNSVKVSTPLSSDDTPEAKTSSFISAVPKSESDELNLIDDGNILPDFQGEVRKLVIRTRGSKPAKMKCSRRYYLELRGENLYQFQKRTFLINCKDERDQYKRKSCKRMVIGESAWRVIKCDEIVGRAFELHHPASGRIYRFICKSQLVANEWYKKLLDAMQNASQKTPVNLISFD